MMVHWKGSIDMDTEELKHLQTLIQEKIRRLRVLEQNAARYGYSVRPEVTLEIQDIRQEIDQLESYLNSRNEILDLQSSRKKAVNPLKKKNLTKEKLLFTLIFPFSFIYLTRIVFFGNSLAWSSISLVVIGLSFGVTLSLFKVRLLYFSAFTISSASSLLAYLILASLISLNSINELTNPDETIVGRNLPVSSARQWIGCNISNLSYVRVPCIYDNTEIGAVHETIAYDKKFYYNISAIIIVSLFFGMTSVAGAFMGKYRKTSDLIE